jgi:hypothetical protein
MSCIDVGSRGCLFAFVIAFRATVTLKATTIRMPRPARGMKAYRNPVAMLVGQKSEPRSIFVYLTFTGIIVSIFLTSSTLLQ